MPRHFLCLQDLAKSELLALIARARQLKQAQKQSRPNQLNPDQPTMAGRTLLLLFEQPSTRTRLSFSTAMHQMGGHCLDLRSSETHLGRGEPIADFARVAGSMVDIIAMRTDSHRRLEEFAEHCGVSLINALSDLSHPCQLLADLMTIDEEFGGVEGRRVAWIGDGNNMLNSWLEASSLLDIELCYACPPGYEPSAELTAAADKARAAKNATEAVSQACAVNTDVWTSMSQTGEEQQRLRDFADYQVDEALMEKAADKAIFLHCLPAKRGQEVSENLLNADCSRAWVQAENRLHAQKALLELLLASQ